MLVGSIEYLHNDKWLKYTVDATDSSETLSMYITSGNYDAVVCMTGDGSDTDIWERRIDIKLGKINVQTDISIVNGKKVKKQVNSDFFCRLGALLRYAKMQCNSRTEKGYLGLSLASKEFDSHACTDYTIPYPMDEDRVLATVTLRYSDLVSISLETDDFKIKLAEDNEVEPRVFYQLKDALSLGLRFNEEYLGFHLKPQVIAPVSSSDGLYHTLEEIIAAHPDKEFSWLLDRDYRIVTDENLQEICDYISAHEGYVYYDTETTGLNINFLSRTGKADVCVGIILSVKYGESFFFPMQMKAMPNLCGGDHNYFMERYIRPILEGKELIAHNMPFDWKVSYIYGINANIVGDTLALLQLTLGAEIKDYKVGLKENAKTLLHRDSLELSDLVVNNDWGESDIKFWDLPPELARLYACADTDNTMGIHQYALQNDLLGKYNARKIYEIEVAFSFAVAYQEFYGHRVDINNLDTLREQLSAEQKDCMSKMEEIVGHTFNPNSSPQLIKIMYGELGIPEQISRKTGRPTTDKETLEKLASITDAEDNIKYPFCVLLREYREYEGVRKIIDSFPEVVTSDGYIFSEVYQYGTTTGRVSIHKPNYQGYNNPVKKNIIPRPGFYMFDTDYSSVEYRVLGNMVGNQRIMQSFEDPDFDYHAYQAAHMYGVPYSAVTKKLRKAAKGINFGLPYGMGDESLGVRVFGEASTENTMKAAALRTAYFKGQEDIRDWFEYNRNMGVEKGYTETFFGRRRYYRRSDFTVNAIRRQAGNQIIQGTAADIFKTAVGRVFKRICKEGWLGKVMLTGFIHDELLGEVSTDINPATFLKVLREEFEVKITNNDGTPWCPLYMGFGYGMSWYEAKSVEIPIKLQWEIVDKYGEAGFPNWDGDGVAFCATVPDMLRDFEVRDIRNQILDEVSQGKEIKPALNNQVLDCVKEDSKLYSKTIQTCFENNDWGTITMDSLLEHKDYIEEYLDKEVHIQSLIKDEDGNYISDFSPAKDTQDALTLYCKLHNVDRSLVNLLDIEEYSGSTVDSSSVSFIVGEDEDEDNMSEDKLQKIIDTRVATLGLYLDTSNKKIILLGVPSQYTNFIRNYVSNDGNGYQVYFSDLNGILDPSKPGALYQTQTYVKSENVQIIQQMYLQYLRSVETV